MNEKKAENIQILDVRNVCNFTDFFVICSGQSRLQLNAISAHLELKFKEEEKIKPVAKEGQKATNWVVLDYGDVIVHIFGALEREYYQLDRIWRDAKPVLRIQ